MSSSSGNVSSRSFALELTKLLLQVAWADHEVAPSEAEALLAYARRSGLDQEDLGNLSAMLAGRAPLSPPNLSILKARRTEVLRAVKELMLKDVRVDEEEEELLAQVSALLA